KMTSSDTFEAGQTYIVDVHVKPTGGYVIQNGCTVTINGVSTDKVFYRDGVNGAGNYRVALTARPTVNITGMGADVTGFELLNSYFEVEATPLDSSKYTIRDITWSDCHLTDDSPIITDSSMFEAGETWQLKLWFKPAYGYAISNPDTLPVTIAGQTATYVGMDGDYYGYKIEKTFSKYLHDYIDLSMGAPTAGMTPSEYAETIKIKNNDRFPYNNFEIGKIQCYRTDWNDFSTFAAGTTYFVYVEIDLKDDTSFEFAHHDSDITALLNGTPVEEYVVVDTDSTWESNFNTYGGVQLSYQVYFTAKGEATGVTVSGTATSFNSDTDDVTIQLIASGASESAYETIVKGNTASYSIAGVLPGTYTMKVMKQNHVTREYTVVVAKSSVTQDVKICKLGDVNMDGKINISDATEIQKGIAGLVSLSDYQNKLADVNKDGKSNVADATHIQKFVAGLIDKV
ncbi:MAG: dockerin type I repeat-containing protein, partial [Ruminococcus sp.]